MGITISTILTAVFFENLLRLWISSVQWRARILESILAVAIGAFSVISIALHIYADLPLETGVSALGKNTFFFAIGFFIYHLHRVIKVPGYTSGLIFHHIAMIALLSASLAIGKMHFYVLVACIPISSAAIRNARWFWRQSGKARWFSGAVAAAASYTVLESLPPLGIFVHFFAFGIYQMKIPAWMWVALVLPGLALAILTFYWSAAFVRKTLSSFYYSASQTVQSSSDSLDELKSAKATL